MKTIILYVVNERARKARRLGGSGLGACRLTKFLNFRPSKIAPDAILGHNRPPSYSCLTSQ